MIERSHSVVKEHQCILLLLVLSYPGVVLNDMIKMDASLMLFVWLLASSAVTVLEKACGWVRGTPL